MLTLDSMLMQLPNATQEVDPELLGRRIFVIPGTKIKRENNEEIGY